MSTNDTAAGRLRDRIEAVTSHSGRLTGRGMVFRCPAHEDRNPSLSLTSIPGRVLMHCHAGCATEDIIKALDLTMADLFDDRKGRAYHYDNGRVVQRYYRDGAKKFRQSGDKTEVQLYHLSRLQDAGPGSVFLVEGEQDVEAIESLDGIATTAPQGATNFALVDVEPLRGRHVTAIVDRDEAGQKWAAVVAERLSGVVAGLRFAQAKTGKDAADHIAAGHGLEDFEVIGDAAVEATTAFSRTLVRRSQLATLPKVEPLIDGVVSLRAVVMLFGPSNVGKSVIALSWACCVAMDVPWLGHSVRRLRVLYVIGEGAFGYDDRVNAWETAWQAKVDDDWLIFSVKPESLSDPVTWAELRGEAIALGVQMVVLDTFSSLAYDADETKDAPVFTRRMSDLAAAIGGTVVVVHHPGWGDPERVRGGSQLEANVDEVLRLSGAPTEPELELTRKKVKDGEVGGKIQLRRVRVPIGVDENGDEVASVTVEAFNGRRRPDDPAPKWLTQWWASYRDALVSPSALERDGIRSKSAFHRDKWELTRTGLVEQGTDHGHTKYRLTRNPDESPS